MRQKDANGNWMHYTNRYTYEEGHCESNAFQQSWFVPHDVQGLVDLMGEPPFQTNLDELFERAEPNFGGGNCYPQGNQPEHQVFPCTTLLVSPGRPNMGHARFLSALMALATIGCAGVMMSGRSPHGMCSMRSALTPSARATTCGTSAARSSAQRHCRWIQPITAVHGRTRS